MSAIAPSRKVAIEIMDFCPKLGFAQEKMFSLGELMYNIFRRVYQEVTNGKYLYRDIEARRGLVDRVD